MLAAITVDEVTVVMVQVIKGFIDIFLNDLPSLPPGKEIKFGINVLLGTAPISKAPYRMAPAELIELNV